MVLSKHCNHYSLEELDEEFWQWIIDFSETKLLQIYGLLEQYSTGKEIHIFRAREDANKYLESKKMAKTENVELTVLCLIQDGDKILMQNRVKQDWKGYTLPGGHVEPGESFVDAVKREMKEETGLDIINPKLAGIKQFPIENGRYIVFLFKTEQFSGKVVSSEEGQMEWIDCSRLSEIDAVDDLDELLRVINDPELTEFQYLVNGDNWIVSMK